jgi:hypothetical protein
LAKINNQNLNNDSITSKSCKSAIVLSNSSNNINSNYCKLITNVTKLKQHRNNLSSNQNIYETLKDLTCVSTNLNQTNATTITLANNIDVAETKVLYSNPKKRKESRFKLSFDQVKLENLVIEGTFGRIYEGMLIKKPVEEELSGSSTDLNENENVFKVFIKTVSDLASTKQGDLMINEAGVLKYVKHKHVNSLLGICVDIDKQPLAVFPFCENGNLKNYLKNMNKNEFKAQVS